MGASFLSVTSLIGHFGDEISQSEVTESVVGIVEKRLPGFPITSSSLSMNELQSGNFSSEDVLNGKSVIRGETQSMIQEADRSA